MGCAFPLRGYQLWKFEGVDLHFQGLLESHDSVTGRSHFVTSVRLMFPSSKSKWETKFTAVKKNDRGIA